MGWSEAFRRSPQVQGPSDVLNDCLKASLQLGIAKWVWEEPDLPQRGGGVEGAKRNRIGILCRLCLVAPLR